VANCIASATITIAYPGARKRVKSWICWKMKGRAASANVELAGRYGAKRTCREMTSCEEARFYLTQCEISRLDWDKDGKPCEGLCR